LATSPLQNNEFAFCLHITVPPFKTQREKSYREEESFQNLPPLFIQAYPETLLSDKVFSLSFIAVQEKLKRTNPLTWNTGLNASMFAFPVA